MPWHQKRPQLYLVARRVHGGHYWPSFLSAETQVTSLSLLPSNCTNPLLLLSPLHQTAPPPAAPNPLPSHNTSPCYYYLSSIFLLLAFCCCFCFPCLLLWLNMALSRYSPNTHVVAQDVLNIVLICFRFYDYEQCFPPPTQSRGQKQSSEAGGHVGPSRRDLYTAVNLKGSLLQWCDRVPHSSAQPQS